MQYLIVVRPFGSYDIGDIVTDAKMIETILETEHCTNVLRILPPNEE